MTWTCHAASAEWGIDRKTLKTRLVQAGHDLSKKKKFTTKQISAAVYGDEKVERIQGLRHDNEIKAMEIEEKKGALYTASAVQKLMADTFQPIRDILNQAPSQLATRCNPTDPTLAREALTEWLRTVLPLVRALWPAEQQGRNPNES